MRNCNRDHKKRRLDHHSFDIIGTTFYISNIKELDQYVILPYRLEIVPDPDEGGYAAQYPELPGCITVGDTMTEVLENAEDAKRAWIAAQLEDGAEIPEPASVR